MATRLQDKRNREASRRGAETTEEIATRLRNNGNRDASLRSAETEKETATRLQLQAQRQAETRRKGADGVKRRLGIATNVEFLLMKQALQNMCYQSLLRHNGHLDRDILSQLQNCLNSVNPYVKLFRYASEICLENQEVQVVIEAKKKPVWEHARRYNLPTGSEVTVIMPRQQTEHLHVIMQTKGGEIQSIHEMHRSYDPLHYILLFPYGEDGYHPYLKKTVVTQRKDKTLTFVPDTVQQLSGRRISTLRFYRYKLQVRADHGNISLRARRLTQQCAADAFAKTESQRARWVRERQKDIRADKYRGLLDVVDADNEVNAGRKVILPPSIYGSPRWYGESFQDAMALVRKYGKPDYFITDDQPQLARDPTLFAARRKSSR